MSQAFVKENDDNGLLHQVPPTLPALLRYLQVENNGMPGKVKHTFLLREPRTMAIEVNTSFTWVDIIHISPRLILRSRFLSAVLQKLSNRTL